MSDTSEITNGCLVHYDSRHIQVRADFMGLCQYNRDEYKDRRKKEPNQECMAKILRLLETLTDHAKAEWKLKTMKAEEKGLAKPKEPERYMIELSNGVIVRLIYSTFGESTVRNSLSYLLEIGYIGYSQEKKNGRPHIWLEQEYVQSLLRLQAQVILAGYEFRPPSYQGANSYPSDAISNPERTNSHPNPAISNQGGCESTDDNISNKIEDITYKTEQEESITSSSEDVRTRAELFEDVVETFKDVKHTTDKHKAMLASSEDEDEEDTLELAAVKPPSKQTVSQSEPGAERGRPQGIGTASAQIAIPSSAQRAAGATVYKMETDQSARTSAKAATIPKRPRGKKPVTMEDEQPKEPPQMPPTEMPWGTRKCLLKFDARRGATLIGKWKNSQASECAKGLATQFDEAYVAAAVEVMEEDSYYADRFVDVCDVANNIHKYRKKIERKLGGAPPPTAKDEDHSDFDIYIGNGPEEREALYQEALEREKNGTLLW